MELLGLHYLGQVVSATSGVAYTQSVFAKKGTNNFLQIAGSGLIYTTATVFANFDLEILVLLAHQELEQLQLSQTLAMDGTDVQ
jgi:hypothetical protein